MLHKIPLCEGFLLPKIQKFDIINHHLKLEYPNMPLSVKIIIGVFAMFALALLLGQMFKHGVISTNNSQNIEKNK